MATRGSRRSPVSDWTLGRSLWDFRSTLPPDIPHRPVGPGKHVPGALHGDPWVWEGSRQGQDAVLTDIWAWPLAMGHSLNFAS